MKIHRVEKEDWYQLAEKAHLAVFSTVKKANTHRIDFALVVENEHGVPMQFVTCRELDSDSVYCQFGGSFPSALGTGQTIHGGQLMLEWLEKEAGYRRVSFLVENTNAAMLKLAMQCGFLIMGVRADSHLHITLLEHVKEFPHG